MFGQKHLLSLTAFGAPSENGRQGAAVQEIMDLADYYYYNPNWGSPKRRPKRGVFFLE